MDSFECFSRADSLTKEISPNNVDSAALSEYTVSNDTSEKTGLASIRKVDSSEVEVEFDMNATLLNPRVFKGVCGTHRWKAYQK